MESFLPQGMEIIHQIVNKNFVSSKFQTLHIKTQMTCFIHIYTACTKLQFVSESQLSLMQKGSVVACTKLQFVSESQPISPSNKVLIPCTKLQFVSESQLKCYFEDL